MFSDIVIHLPYLKYSSVISVNERNKRIWYDKQFILKENIWSINGERHRDGNLPAVEYRDGRKEWWRNGKRRTNFRR